MPAPPRSSSPRYRRRIIAAGLIAAGALFSFVAPWYVGRIEADLESRLPDELAEAGFAGLTAEFSGQDGTLRCERPLDDPEAASNAAYDVWGVRAITLDRSCRVNVAPLTSNEQPEDATPATTQPASSASVATSMVTVADLITDDRRFSYLTVLLEQSGMATELGDPAADPVTVFAPTDAAFDKLSADANARLRSEPGLLERVLRHHVASGALPANELEVGPLPVLDGDTLDVTRNGSVTRVDGSRLVDNDLTAGNGVVHAIDTVLIPEEVDLESPTTSIPATTAAPATTTPPAPVAATPEQAAAMTAELNEYVAANPILFAVGQNVVTPESSAVLDHIAARILELPGVAVTVEGHTDSDGSPQRNLDLSQQRAQAVVLELVARGLGEVPLTPVGYGSEQRVIVNGVEDKNASRRVAFVVEVAP